MSIQIRQGVFEANSSSTHSIAMCSESDFKKWVRGEVYLNEAEWENADNPAKDKTFITKEEALELVLSDEYYEYWPGKDFREMNDDEFDEAIRRHFDVYAYNDYCEDSYLEYYEEHYTTESGDKVVAFGQYGYN